jgi:hypothetical protein
MYFKKSPNFHFIICYYVPQFARQSGAKQVLIMESRSIAKNKAKTKHALPVSGESCVLAQLIEALRYKPEGSGFDSRWCP